MTLIGAFLPGAILKRDYRRRRDFFNRYRY